MKGSNKLKKTLGIFIDSDGGIFQPEDKKHDVVPYLLCVHVHLFSSDLRRAP